MFEISTHSQREEEIERGCEEEEIERGCEEEREGFPVPIFPPLCFKIARMLAG